jgi:hypothetical protein
MSNAPRLTPSEQIRFDHIKVALAAFDEAKDFTAKNQAYETLVSLIPELTFLDVEHYWRSESEDEFAWRHAIEKIDSLGPSIAQQQIVELALSLRHSPNTDDSQLFDLMISRHGDAFERLYGTPSGTFWDLLTADAIETYEDFVIGMKRQGPIRL